MTIGKSLMIILGSFILSLLYITDSFAGDNQLIKRLRRHHELMAKQYAHESRKLCSKAKEECFQQHFRKKIKSDQPLSLYKRIGLGYKKFKVLAPFTPFYIKGKVKGKVERKIKKFFKVLYFENGKPKTALILQTAIKPTIDILKKDCQTLFDKCIAQ